MTKKMDFKKKKSFGRMGTPRCTDFIIVKMCPTLGPAPTREGLRTTNNMINQVFGDVFYFLFLGGVVGTVVM